jgi:hypothetical protein
VRSAVASCMGFPREYRVMSIDLSTGLAPCDGLFDPVRGTGFRLRLP